MKCAIYARVSTDEQARPGLASIPHQIELCRRLAEADGLNPDLVITDDISGQTLDRPGLQDLFSSLAEIERLYVYDTTRLGRNRRVLAAIRQRLSSAGVSLRLVHGDTSEMDPESQVYMESILDASAEAEIIRLKRRARMGREQRAASGLMAGKVPVGWRAVRDDRGKAVRYEHDPAFDAFFSDLESLFLSGLPYAALPRALRARGHVSPFTGRMWSVTALKNILRNPVHRGDLVFGWTTRPASERIVVKDAFPPRWHQPALVTRELRRRSNLKGAARRQSYPFTGLLICDFCEWKMTVQPSYWTRKDGSRGSTYRYRCSKHSEYQVGRWPDDCQPNQITRNAIVRQLSDWFRRMRDPDALDEYLKTISPNGHNPADIARLRSRMADVEAKLNGLIDRFATAPASAMPAIRQRMAELSAEREEIAQAIEDHNAQAETLDAGAYRAALLEAAEHFEDLLNAPAHVVQAGLSLIFPEGIRVRKGRLIFGDEQ